MKKHLKQLLNNVIHIVAMSLIIAAIVLSFARTVTPLFQYYHADAEKWASKIIGKPVQIAYVNANWRGFEPIIDLHDVQVFNDERGVQLIKIRELQIGIDVFSSIWQRKLVTGMIGIVGAHVSVHQDSENHLSVDGITDNRSGNAAGQSDQLLGWLLSQSRISLEDINVFWYRNNGQLVPISNLTLHLTNRINKHVVVGSAHFDETVSGGLSFTAEILGDLQDPNRLLGNIYLKAKQIHPQEWLKDKALYDFSVTNGQINFEIWLRWHAGHIERVTSKINTRDLNFQVVGTNKNQTIEKGSVLLTWQTLTGGGWHLVGEQLQLDINGHQWPEGSFQLQTHYNERQLFDWFGLHINYFQIEDFDFLLMNSSLFEEDIRALFTDLAMVGTAKDVILEYSAIQQFKMRGKITQFGVRPHKSIPGIVGLDGDFMFDQTGGSMNLNGTSMVISSSKMFKNPIKIKQFGGELLWNKDDDGWKVQLRDIELSNRDFSIDGYINFFVEKSLPDINVDMVLGVKNLDVSKVSHYLPEKIMEKSLVEWLDAALVSGHSHQGKIILQGPLKNFPFVKQTGEFNADILLEDVTLDYDSEWPRLQHMNGKIIFAKNSMMVDVSSAKINNVTINHVKAIIPVMSAEEDTILTVEGKVDSNLHEGLKFVHQSPLDDSLGKDIQGIQGSGPMKLDLKLHLPLGDSNSKTVINGTIDLLGNQLNVPDWTISMDDLSGQLFFTENGLRTNKINGTLFGQPVSIGIDTIHLADYPPEIQVTLDGSVTSNYLTEHYLSNFPSFLDGKANFSSALYLRKVSDNRGNLLSIETTMDGMAVNLPLPFSKQKEQKKLFRVDFNFSDKRRAELHTHFGSNINGLFLFDNEKSHLVFHGGQLMLGGKPAQRIPDKGIVINGQVNQLDIMAWVAAIKGQSSNMDENSYFNKLVLDVGTLSVLNENIDNAVLTINNLPENLMTSINSANIHGTVTFSKGEQLTPIKANFSTLSIPAMDHSKKAQFKSKDIPNINFRCDNFIYADKNYGKLILDLRTIPDELIIDNFELHSPAYHLLAKGSWVNTSSQQKTTLTGTVRSTDLGLALRELGFPSHIQSEKTGIRFDLSWPNTPYAPQGMGLNGRLSVDLSTGRLTDLGKDADSQIGLGRLLSLFSVESVLRRLQFDFSDLSGKGFDFNEIKGDFLITNGLARTANVDIKAPVAHMQLSGDIDLLEKRYGLTLMVTPHATSGLPIAATAVGGPVVGAVAWMVDKLVIEKMITYGYIINGPWSQPNIVPLAQMDRSMKEVIRY